MSKPLIVIVGGHGKIALHFARLASPTYTIHSLVRSSNHFAAVREAGAEPVLLSLEDAGTGELAEAFEGARNVVFAAGSGGKGGDERTKKVDFEGAVKVFDAIEKVKGDKPRLLLISAIDTRDTSKPPPPYYNSEDIAKSKKGHEALKVFYEYKLEADRNLVKRTAFQWTILRPGTLADTPGKKLVTLGRAHSQEVSREDVAATLLALAEEPKTSGLALDLTAGETPIAQAVQEAAEKQVSDYHDQGVCPLKGTEYGKTGVFRKKI